MHSWEISRRETSNYKNVGAANAGTALVSLQAKQISRSGLSVFTASLAMEKLQTASVSISIST